jgi:DNA-directed RNA polymerase specialized sigma24 family protein
VRSDEALLRSCASGDPEAWRRFVELYSGWVLRVARAALRRIGGSDADAEDCRSEVFRQLLERDRAMLRSLKPPYHVKAWLAIVARRACSRTLRRRPVAPLAADPPAPAPREDRLQELLGLLPPEDALLLRLFFEHDASYGDIAALLRMSPESVGKRKFRALESLRALLRERGEAE